RQTLGRSSSSSLASHHLLRHFSTGIHGFSHQEEDFTAFYSSYSSGLLFSTSYFKQKSKVRICSQP
ncbi:unnamed protein product, partial [Cuscuta campestris]